MTALQEYAEPGQVGSGSASADPPGPEPTGLSGPGSTEPGSTGPGSTGPGSTGPVPQDPADLFRQLIERAFNGGDLSAIEELISADLVEHQFERPGSTPPLHGRQGARAIVSSVRGSAPDFRLTIDDLVVSHDTVWARMRATGTDTGGHFGRPPTGRTFDIQVIDICRFDRGVMVEHWGVPDRMEVVHQLGFAG